MAEEEKDKEEAAPEEQQSGKKGKKVLIALCGLLLLVVGAGAPAAYFLLTEKTSEIDKLKADILAAEEANVAEEGWNDEDEYDEDEEPLGAILPMSTFVVNLAENGSYLRCQVQLEFTGTSVPKRFYARQVPIRDALIKLMASRTPEELSSADGRQELKDLILETVNNTVKREIVKEVYFTQFVMQ